MTGMSSNGKQFTYVNQLASSDSDLSKREEWFTCACCPPNVTRLLGYAGGYLWTFNYDEEKSAVDINVHMYDSAKLSVPTASGTIELEQKSNWPWGGEIDFTLKSPSSLTTTIRLRIPGWAEEWHVSTTYSLHFAMSNADKTSIGISKHPGSHDRGRLSDSASFMAQGQS